MVSLFSGSHLTSPLSPTLDNAIIWKEIPPTVTYRRQYLSHLKIQKSNLRWEINKLKPHIKSQFMLGRVLWELDNVKDFRKEICIDLTKGLSPKVERSWKHLIQSVNNALSLNPIDCNPELISMINNNQTGGYCLKLASEIQDLNFLFTFLNGNKSIDISVISRHRPGLKYNSELQLWYYSKNLSKNYSIHIFQNELVYICDNIENEYSLLDKNHWNAWCDVITERCLTLTASFLSDTEIGKHYIPDKRDIIDFYKNGDMVLICYGNEGYKCLKMVETLCMREFIKKSQPVCVEENIFPDYVDVEYDKLCEEFPCATKFLTFINTYHENHGNFQHIGQFFGLYRHFSHPDVKALEGFWENVARNQAMMRVDLKKIRDLKISWRQEYVDGYIKKHKEWPGVEFSSQHPSNEIWQGYTHNRFPNLNSKFYDETDWLTFKFKKNSTPIDSLNYLRIISDKVCSADMTDLCSACKKRVTPPAETRQTILRWLEDLEEDIMKILNRICEENLSPEWLCMGYCPKEREMKIKPRCFGLLVYYMRQFSAIREHLLAENITPYIKSITMTYSGLQLEQRLYKMSKLDIQEEHESQGKLPLGMGEDFDKWCSRHRKYEVHPIGEDLDDIFGIEGLYSTTHNYPPKCLSYLGDNSEPIDVELGHIKIGRAVSSRLYSWPEGLCQKIWTIKTIAATNYLKRQLHVEYEEVAQGDNLATTFYYPSSSVEHIDGVLRLLPSVQTRLTRWRGSTVDYLKDVNLLMKDEETWFSTQFMTYGKQMRVNGIQLSVNLKKICRMYPSGVEGFPSLENCLSTISSGAVAAANSSVGFDLVYTMMIGMYLMTIYLFNNHNFVTQEPMSIALNSKEPYRIGNKEIRMIYIRQEVVNRLREFHPCVIELMCLLPNSLGGYPILPPTSLIIRGFPDPVSEGLTFLKKLLLKGKVGDQLTYLINNMINQKLESTKDFLMLFQNPTSLNLESPPRQEQIIRSITTNFLRTSHIVRAKLFKDLLEVASRKEDELVKYLSTMIPLHPRIAGDIIDATLSGIANTVVKKFTRTVTITRLAGREGGVEFLKRLILSDYHLFAHFFNQSLSHQQLKIDLRTYCSTRLALKLRRDSWGRNDIEGVTTPHPLEHLKLYPCINGNCERCDDGFRDDYIYFRIPENVDFGKIFKEIGPISPYFGSETREPNKLIDEKLKILDIDPWFRKSMRLDGIIGWVSAHDSNMAKLVIFIMSQAIENVLDHLDDRNLEISSSVAHRYRDPKTKHWGYPNSLLTPLTYVYISSDTMTVYQRGGKNVTIHFQSSYILGISSVIREIKDGKGQIVYHYHEDCKECVLELDESTVDFPEPPSDGLFRSLNLENYNIQKAVIHIKDLRRANPHSVMNLPDGDRNKVFITHDQHNDAINLELFGIYVGITVGLSEKTPEFKLQVMKKFFTSNNFLTIMKWISLYIISRTIIKIAEEGASRGQERLLMSCLLSLQHSLSSIASLFSSSFHIPDLLDDLFLTYTFRFVPHGCPFLSADIDRILSDAISCMCSQIITQIITGEPTLKLTGHKMIMIPEMRQVHLVTLVANMISQITIINNKSIDWTLFQGQVINFLGIDENGQIQVDSFISFVKIQRIAYHVKLSSKILISHKTVDVLAKEVSDPILMNNISLPTMETRKPDILIQGGGFGVILYSHKLNFNVDSFGCPIEKSKNKLNPSTRSLVYGQYRNLKRHTHHLRASLRHVSLTTTAQYKIWPIYQELREKGRDMDCAFFFGDGSGGMGGLFSEYFPQSLIYINSLFDLGGAAEQIAISYRPGASFAYPTLDERLINIENMSNERSDIMNEKFWDECVENYGNYIGAIDFICSDAESPHLITHQIDYIDTLLSGFRRLDPNGKALIMIKIIVDEPQKLTDLIKKISEYTEYFGFYRSYYSNYMNGEIYLMVTGWSDNYLHKKGMSDKLIKDIMETTWISLIDSDISKKELTHAEIDEVDKLLSNKRSDLIVFGNLSRLMTRSAILPLTFPLSIIGIDKRFLLSDPFYTLHTQYDTEYTNSALGERRSGSYSFKLSNLSYLISLWIGFALYSKKLTLDECNSRLIKYPYWGITFWNNKRGQPRCLIGIFKEHPHNPKCLITRYEHMTSASFRDGIRIINSYLHTTRKPVINYSSLETLENNVLRLNYYFIKGDIDSSDEDEETTRTNYPSRREHDVNGDEDQDVEGGEIIKGWSTIPLIKGKGEFFSKTVPESFRRFLTVFNLI